MTAGADLDLLADLSGEAGRIAMRFFGKQPRQWTKSGDSPVSEADIAVNRFLFRELTSARPEYGWLSEETECSSGYLADRPTFVVDPIDGTRAFLQGRSTWCISIAVVVAGRPVAGVLECPAKEEHYAALHQKGAFLNASPLVPAAPPSRPRIAGPKSMINAMPRDLRFAIRPHPYIPSLAYRLAMIASGRIDATFVKPNAHDWDLAAADLILEEAGGSIIDSSGERLVYDGRNIRHGTLVAGSGALLKELHAHLPATAEANRTG